MPNRIIKETICTSDNLDQLTPQEEVFFYRLMVNCDDYGRSDARPRILLAKCFPLKIGQYSIEAIADWLNKLASTNLIILYEVDGRPYLQMATWDKHQRVRSKRSKYPAPDSEKAQMLSLDYEGKINVSNDTPFTGTCDEYISDVDNSLTDDSNLTTDDDTLTSNASVIQSNPIQSESKRILSAQFADDTPPMILAELLRKEILKNNAKARLPSNLNTWALVIDRMIRLDKRSPDEIREIILWCQNDDFWYRNILSADKLRKQFDKLWLQANGRKKLQENIRQVRPEGRVTY